MSSADVQTQSFMSSFTKGSFFSLCLILFFCAWSYMKGAEFKQNILENLPAVSLPVSQIGNEDSQRVVMSESINNNVQESQTNSENIVEQEAEEEPLDIALYEENLVENSQFGLLPKPDVQKNLSPFDAYKRNFIKPTGQRKFQLILGPITFSTELARDISNQLPQDVSILLSPYSPNLEDLMTIFKQSGHEVWLELPIETMDKTIDTGPLSLRADFSGNKNMSVYKRVLGRVSGYVGLLTKHTDNTTLSFSSARLEQLQADMYQRGVGFSYVANQQLEPLENIATSYNGQIRHIQSHQNMLFSLQKAAWDSLINSNEDISLLYTPLPNDISDMSKWLKTLPERGYVIAPLSARQE